MSTPAPAPAARAPTYVTIRVAAARLGFSSYWTWKLVSAGKLPGVRDPQGGWLIPTEWVDAYAAWHAGPALPTVGGAGA